MEMSGIDPTTASAIRPMITICERCEFRVLALVGKHKGEARLSQSIGNCQARLTIEAPARVFHQGRRRFDCLAKTGYSFAVFSLPIRRCQSLLSD